MMSNNCNNFSVVHHVRSAWCDVYRPFYRGIPPSTEKLLQSFLKSSVFILQDHTCLRCYKREETELPLESELEYSIVEEVYESLRSDYINAEYIQTRNVKHKLESFSVLHANFQCILVTHD